MNKAEIDRVTGQVVNAAIKVHSTLGPGLLESAYEACLAHELRTRGFQVGVQVPMPVLYCGVKVEVGYRLDLVVNDVVIVDLKAVTKMIPIYDAQLLSYLRLSGRRVGLLINFHVPLLRDGIKRIVDGLEERD